MTNMTTQYLIYIPKTPLGLISRSWSLVQINTITLQLTRVHLSINTNEIYVLKK